MAGFDDLKRQAEQYLGKDTVRRIEREIEKKAEESKDKPKHIVKADDIDFSGVASLFSAASTDSTPPEGDRAKVIKEPKTKAQNRPPQETMARNENPPEKQE